MTVARGLATWPKKAALWTVPAHGLEILSARPLPWAGARKK